ncbi:Methane oxygenase PmoA [Cyclobacterium lianum]|uniref:Methane oxygenase PmoA n=1 Tax=Cyclobacterium lianum TaxID=388280 RepID=A0A1M7ML67_9BACT|nr:PmoA family protein [Cyclobacterium lianum]SHM91619.1 Methane oxygenase PmoA [Cyclobacterium lianum]
MLKINLPVLLVAILAMACTSSPIARFSLENRGVERKNSPLLINLEKTLPAGSNYELVNEATGRAFPAQVLESGQLLVFIDSMGAETAANYALRQTDDEMKSQQAPSINVTGEGVEISIAGSPVLFYQTATAYPEEGLPDYYKRSGMIHPLYSPEGQVLTDAFPAGHTHQHAVFNAWVNTRFKGEKVDFWNQHQETGTVEHVELNHVESGSNTALFESILSHISLKDGEVLEEKWRVMVYPVSDYYLFDLYSEQTNTSSDTLHILEYHYGGMGFRGSQEWNEVDTLNYTNSWNILTSEGFTNENANHTDAAWVAAYGEVEGKTAGSTIFGFPDNFRYPQPIRVHPTMPYWVYAPMVNEGFYIAPGEKFKSSFRYYVHQGEPDEKVIESIANDLKNPILVNILDQ